MAQDIFCAGGIALVLLGEVPAIGPLFRKKEEAEGKAHSLLNKIDRFTRAAYLHPYQIIFKRQVNGCYTLVIKSDGAAIDVLENVDELLLKRFQKIFRSLFILTCFYEAGGTIECLAVTEGLGAVLYSYSDCGFFQSR